MRQFARAESLFKSQITAGRATSQQYTNLIPILFNSGKVAEAQQFLNEYRQRFPSSSSVMMPVSFLYARGQLDSMEAMLKGFSQDANPIVRVNGLAGLSNYSLLRGRVNDALRFAAQARQIQITLGQPLNPLNDSLQASYIDLALLGDTARAVRRLDATVATANLREMPYGQRSYMTIALLYALVGNVARSRAFVALDSAEAPDSAARRNGITARRATSGYIALAQGRYQDALRDLWRADTTFDGPDGNCVICVLDDIGLAWYRAGVADSAIYYWERYLGTPMFGRQGIDAMWRPMIVKQLAEAYEAKGDVPNAARRYREFISLWERADPKLQQQVADAKFRLRRLADTEGKKVGPS